MNRTLIAVSLSIVALVSLARSATAQTELFGVESSGAVKLFQVQDGGGLVAFGSINVGSIPAAGAGTRLFWYPAKAAFRAGQVDGTQWDNPNIGKWSAAFGENTTASGVYSTAMGFATIAAGPYSTALGSGAEATGGSSFATGAGTIAAADNSTAMGLNTRTTGNSATAMGNASHADGFSSMALGYQANATGIYSTSLGAGTTSSGGSALATGAGTIASADNSTAMGLNTRASGNASTALGTGTSAAGIASVAMGSGVAAQGDGSFIFGDRSTNFALTATANTFMVRAFGGLGFNTGVNIGCDLPAGSGAWSCTSSRLAKEAFEEVDGEEILSKLAGMPIERWRYIGTMADHIGPFAEDFRAAFGLGESATKIATVDADGIALRGVQALERRTTELREENAAMRAEVTALRADNVELGRRLEALAGRLSP